MHGFRKLRDGSGEDADRRGLIAKISARVISVVSIVSCIVLSIAASMSSTSYEKELRKRLEADLDATTHAIELRMSRVEYATITAAMLISDAACYRENVDSILLKTFVGIQCVDAVVLMYKTYFFPEEGRCLVRFAYRDHDTDQPKIYPDWDFDYVYCDENWIVTYGKGADYWSTPYTIVDPATGESGDYVAFSTIVRNSSGEKYAILCSTVLLEWVEDIVRKNRSNENIDVSVLAMNGEYVVRPAREYSLDDSKNIIVYERNLDRLGWTLVFSVPRSVISDTVRRLIVFIVIIIVILLMAAAIAIQLSVRYVATPFVQERKREAENRAAIQRELDIAGETQRNLLPHIFPPYPDRKDVELFGCLRPAYDVGGDIYDYFILGDYLFFCIGDVSGKGLPASMFMSATHYLFRCVFTEEKSISESVSQMNMSLCAENQQCTFVTFFVGRLNLVSGKMEYCNAGHNSPILIRNNGTAGNDAGFMPVADCMPLGVDEDAEFLSRTVEMNAGDAILLYTDGVTEAKDIYGDNLGDMETLKCVSESASGTAEEIVNAVIDRISVHAGATVQSDDITMLCIRKNNI